MVLAFSALARDWVGLSEIEVVVSVLLTLVHGHSFIAIVFFPFARTGHLLGRPLLRLRLGL